MSLLRFVALCLLSLALSALDAKADKRVALVIGNGAYRNVPTLANPTNDAADIGAALAAARRTLARQSGRRPRRAKRANRSTPA